MYVIPKAGLSIPDPAQRGTPGYFLPAAGRDVQPSIYWTRRLRDGDVTTGPVPVAAPPSPDPLNAAEHLARAAAELAAAAKPAA